MFLASNYLMAFHFEEVQTELPPMATARVSVELAQLVALTLSQAALTQQPHSQPSSPRMAESQDW